VRDRIDGQIAAGTGLIFDDDLLAPNLRQPGSDNT
jgi:hypothetical protein